MSELNRKDLFGKTEHIIVRFALVLMALISVIKLLTIEVMTLMAHFKH